MYLRRYPRHRPHLVLHDAWNLKIPTVNYYQIKVIQQTCMITYVYG